MNAEQFNVYIQTLQADQDRAVARQDRTTTRRDGQREQERLLDTHIKSTRACDGSSIPLVREWLHDIDMAFPYFPVATADSRIQQIIMATVQGPMKRFYERFLDAQPNRNNVTWPAIRASIRAAYLTPDEAEFLRSELETIKQTAYETSAAYARRFVEAANVAYDQADRNDVVQRIVLERYVKGLRSKTLKRRLCLETIPDTIDTAIAAVENFAVQEERHKRMTGDDADDPTPGETPMEIGAIRPLDRPHVVNSDAPSTDPSMAAAMLRLARQMEGLQKEMTKLKSNSLNPQAAAASTPATTPAFQPTQPIIPPLMPLKYPSHSPDGQTICYECGGFGHIGKNCEQRRRRLAQASQQSGN
jgi:hypothetical protein